MALKFLNDGYFAGKVGIIENNPTQTLHVGDGTIDAVIRSVYTDGSYTDIHGYGIFMSRSASYIKPVTDNTQGLYLGDIATGANWSLVQTNAATNIWKKDATEFMRLTSSGNLGIGTTSPVSSLNITTTKTVALDTAAKFLTLGLTVDDLTAGNTAGGGGGIAFRSKNTNAGAQVVFGAIDAIKESANVSDFKGSLRFFTNQNSTGVPLERMRITSAGKVGIGTVSPIELLHLYGGVGNPTRIRLQADDGQDDVLTFHQATTQKGAVGYDDSDDVVSLTYGGLSATTGIKINSSGNVGIGTASPTYPLHVSSTFGYPILVERTNSNDAGIRFKDQSTTDPNSVRIGAIGDAFRIFTDGSERFRITSAGNIGIGTTSPLRKLSVFSTSIVSSEFKGSNTGHLIDISNSNASPTYNGIRFQHNNTFKMGVTHIADGTTKGYIQIGNGYATGNEILVVDGRTSNVGIGTTTPLSLLEIASNNPVINFKDTTAGTDLSYRYIQNVDGKFLFAKANDAYNSFTTHMVIGSNGNVGIGTTSPNYMLHLGGDTVGAVNGQLAFGDVGNVPSGLIQGYRVDGSYKGELRFSTSTSGGTVTQRMVIDEDGNVGIGTTSPGAKLHVDNSAASLALHVSRDAGSAVTNGTTVVSGAAVYINGNEDTGSDALRIGSMANSTGDYYIDVSNYAGTANYDLILQPFLGNVGIGTTSPGYKLDVESSTTPLHLNRTGGATALIGLDINGTTRGLLGATTTAAFVSYSTAAAPLVTVANTGGVQFNTYGAGTLVTDASGNITVSSGGGAGGPFLPLAGGTLTGALAGTSASFTGSVTAGSGSGSVALTVNDGGGNANVTFNHANETPDVNGNSFRIRANVDSSSGAAMLFELKEGVTAGTQVSTLERFRIDNTGVKVRNPSSGVLDLQRDDTSVVASNALGKLRFMADDPTNGSFNIGAEIKAKAEAAWSTDNYPSRLEFYTTTTDTSILALTIDKDQDATFSTQAFATTATSSGDASSTLTTKGYVDSLITGATIYRGTWDPDVTANSGNGTPDLSTVTQTSGYYYICSADGTAHPNGTTGTPAVPCEPDSWSVGDWVVWNDDVADCAGTGTGAWQKVDNSSVLSGVGTGQTVALWEGAGSVTDSETLGNAPITVSGNNATFAGTVTLSSNSSTFINLANTTSTTGKTWRFSSAPNGKLFITQDGVIDVITLDHTTGNATFAGNVDVNGTQITVGTNDSIFAENNLRFKSTGAAFIDHNTVSQSIKFRLSNSSSLDVTPLEITPNYSVFATVPFVGTMAAGDNSTRAASTAFVTTAVATGVGAYLPLVGGTLTGDLTLDDGSGASPRLILKNSTNETWEIFNGTQGVLNFYENSDLRLSFAQGGNATFAGQITTTKNQITTDFATTSAIRLKPAATTNSGGKSSIFLGTSTADNYGISLRGARNSASGMPTFELATHNNSNNGTVALSIDNSQKATFTGDVVVNNSLSFSTNGFADFGNIGTGAMRFKPSGNTLALTLTGANATFAGGITVVGNDAQFNHNIILEGSVFHKDDTNTSFGFPADDNIALTTSGTERMRINSSGNVGIGTTLPTTALTIGKAISPTAYGSQASMIEFKSYYPGYDTETVKSAIYSGVSAVTGLQTTRGFMSFWTADYTAGGGQSLTEKMRIETNGKVGIGTDSPQSKLQVAGGIQMADDTATASASKVGTMRYRTGTEYVDVTGTNLISNPDFTTDTVWTKETGWTITGGELVATAAAGNTACYQVPSLTNGSIYRCTFTISEYTSGKVSFRAGTAAANTFFDAVGTYSVIMTAGGALQGRFGLESGVTTTLKISQCSIVEVTAEDASYADMCMQTGASTYEWVNMVRNTY